MVDRLSPRRTVVALQSPFLEGFSEFALVLSCVDQL